MPSPPWLDVDELQRAGADIARMLELRKQLAEAELRSDGRALRRFAILAGCGAVTLVVGLPVLVQAGLLRVEAALSLELGWLSLLVGAASTLLGAMLMAWAWRRLRLEFNGLRQSLAEVREDAEWIREWLQKRGKRPRRGRSYNFTSPEGPEGR